MDSEERGEALHVGGLRLERFEVGGSRGWRLERLRSQRLESLERLERRMVVEWKWSGVAVEWSGVRVRE